MGYSSVIGQRLLPSAVKIRCCARFCFHALFLSQNLRILVTKFYIPKHTYLSVPQVLLHSGNKPAFVDIETGAYEIGTTELLILLAELRNMYISNSLTCISFHRKKPIPIGKIGMILTDDFVAVNGFKSCL